MGVEASFCFDSEGTLATFVISGVQSLLYHEQNDDCRAEILAVIFNDQRFVNTTLQVNVKEEKDCG